MTKLYFVALLSLFVPSVALATPGSITATASADDAFIVLTMVDEQIAGDSDSQCTVRVNVGGENVAFSALDHLYVWVYEDDVAGDDLLFSTDFVVTAAEVSSNRVERSFDCSGDFGTDSDTAFEFYAEARVEKAECGAFCSWDRPVTTNVNITQRTDDAAEDDDTMGTAPSAPAGTAVERIAADADYQRFQLTSASNVEVLADFDLDTGGVDVEIVSDSDAILASATDDSLGSSVVTILGAGTYFIRTTPRAAPDYNFYDLTLNLSSASCVTGTSETRDCGMCGEQARTCSAGTWGGWGACSDEGECVPSSVDSRGCGVGGVEQRTCSASCEWSAFGTCVGMSSDDDAGVSPRVDAGPIIIGADGGVPGSDGGVPRSDGSVPRADGGAPPVTSGGCAIGSRSTPHGALALVVGIAGLLLRRRRR